MPTSSRSSEAKPLERIGPTPSSTSSTLMRRACVGAGGRRRRARARVVEARDAGARARSRARSPPARTPSSPRPARCSGRRGRASAKDATAIAGDVPAARRARRPLDRLLWPSCDSFRGLGAPDRRLDVLEPLRGVLREVDVELLERDGDRGERVRDRELRRPLAVTGEATEEAAGDELEMPVEVLLLDARELVLLAVDELEELDRAARVPRGRHSAPAR